MKRNGYTIVELVAVLVVFSVVYFTVAVITSKNFKGDYKEDIYENKIASIEKQASIYGEASKDELFKEDKTIYMTIEELARKNVVISSSEGVVADPRNNEKNINELKVKITLEDDKVVAKVLG